MTRLENETKKIGPLKCKINGVDNQSLQIILDPKQHIICKKSAILYYEEGIDVKVMMNNPDANKKSGFMSKIVDASKAVIKGEQVFVNIVVNNSHSPRKISLAGMVSGRIIPLKILSPRGEYFINSESFICASSKVHMGVSNNNESGSTMFTINEKLTKLEGDGSAFIRAEGNIERHELTGANNIIAEPSTVLARSSSVDLKTIKISKQGKTEIKSTLSGRGVVYIQTHPTNKLVNKIIPDILGLLEQIQKKNK